jgi:hypothetical protein
MKSNYDLGRPYSVSAMVAHSDYYGLGWDVPYEADRVRGCVRESVKTARWASIQKEGYEIDT